MPTIFSHAIFAVITGKAVLSKRAAFWFVFFVAVCAVIPDADVISYSFRVERGGMLAHRGFTHSIVFAFLCGSFTAFLVRKFFQPRISLIKPIVFFSPATLSHPLLDMLTDGGSGVALFSPFSNQRFFFSWQPIEVSPIGLRFFGSRGLFVILSEIIFVWLPAIGILMFASFVRVIRNKTS